MTKNKILQKLEDMLEKVETQLTPLIKKQYTREGLTELEFERELQLIAQRQTINELIVFITMNK